VWLADAVLAILAKREQQIAIEASDWQRLFASEGYKRLAKREQEMKVPIDESEFREFVLSEDLLALRVGLRESLDQYASLDLSTLSLKTIDHLLSTSRCCAARHHLSGHQAEAKQLRL